MTKVSLRVYNREIEGMIEAGQLDEAIAHCQHILKSFPMHIETYRLLGKTFLEARRYADAADIFQRALMAVPDDFVSHVGMSIIRDDEGKLDDAIWHMERAFEVQPSNSAIQGELRRLYGRRDGVEPSKIRLSRDALANMYSQGELFNQAIAEIRTVLAEDPNRPDLQVMLARAYYRAGQKVEAAEMAATLLKKYPYCLDALRVLVDVLPGSKNGENTQIYRHRLGMLDPYSAFTTDSVFGSDQVAETAVNLERLEYKAGAAPASSEPGWASSLGIQLAGEKKVEPAPEWMYTAETTEQPSSTPGSSESAPNSAPVDNSVPEWMRSAGWQESKGSEQANPVESGQANETPTEPIAQANIPDWLKSMAPTEGTDVENSAPEESGIPKPAGGEDVPDWLKSMAPSAATGSANAEAEPSRMEASSANAEPVHAQEGEVPDWLKSMAPAQEAGSENAGAEPSPMEIPSMNTEPEPTQEGKIPDWLKSMAPTGGADLENVGAEPSPMETPSANAEPEPAQEGDVPDWLKSMAPTAGADLENVGAEPSPMETPSTDAEPEPAQEGDVPDWLKSMAPTVAIGSANAEAGSSPIETPALNAEPEPSQPGGFPDWLTGTDGGVEMGTPGKSDIVELEISQTEEQPAPIEPVAQEPTLPAVSAKGSEGEPFQPTGEVKPLDIGDDALGWLESLAAKQGAKSEELLTKPQERSVEMPDWLNPTDQATPAPVAQNAEKTPRETLPLEPLASFFDKPVSPPVPAAEDSIAESDKTPSPESQNEEDTKPVGIEDDTMAWLEQLGDTQEPKHEELLTQPGDHLDTSPDWIQSASVEKPVAPAEMPASTEPASSEEDVTITSWLNTLDKTDAASDIPPASPVQEDSHAAQADLPGWLKDLEKPAPSTPVEPEADLPDWLRQPAESAKQEQTPQPSVLEPASEPPLEPEMPAWMDETDAKTGQAAPTAPDEWIPAEKSSVGSESTPAAEPLPADEPVSTPAEIPSRPASPVVTGMLAQIPANNKDAEFLSIAQSALENKPLEEAMKAYGKLIKKGRLLDEVIHDLRETLYRYPVDVIIWQTLGDAYMRANHLQDALDAYTKAEELLR